MAQTLREAIKQRRDECEQKAERGCYTREAEIDYRLEAGWLTEALALPDAAPTEQLVWDALDEELSEIHCTKASFPSLKAAIRGLIEWHVQVATDPKVNGGYELRKVEAPIDPKDVQAGDWVRVETPDGMVRYGEVSGRIYRNRAGDAVIMTDDSSWPIRWIKEVRRAR